MWQNTNPRVHPTIYLPPLTYDKRLGLNHFSQLFSCYKLQTGTYMALIISQVVLHILEMLRQQFLTNSKKMSVNMLFHE